MKYAQPTQFDEALALLAKGKWTILAGGTDYYPGLRDQAPTDNVLSIHSLKELRGVEEEGGFLRIGALVSWSDIINADLPPSFNGLKLAAQEVGSVQIQNRATLVGNLCNASPAADGVPPLLTLDASVELVSKNNKRLLPLSEFVLGNRKTALHNGELVSAILIPKQSAKGQSTFIKLGARKYLVISISMVAARMVCDERNVITDLALSIGSCSLVAQRLPELEQQLVGEQASSGLIDRVSKKHLKLLAPIDDVRATKQYRADASLELLRRALASLVDATV